MYSGTASTCMERDFCTSHQNEFILHLTIICMSLALSLWEEKAHFLTRHCTVAVVGGFKQLRREQRDHIHCMESQGAAYSCIFQHQRNYSCLGLETTEAGHQLPGQQQVRSSHMLVLRVHWVSFQCSAAKVDQPPGATRTEVAQACSKPAASLSPNL